MALAATQPATPSLSCRAGKTLTFDIFVYDETVDPVAEENLSAYSGRMQIRDLRGRRRVLMNVVESGAENTPLQRVSPGHWRVFLGKSYTSWLPYLSQVEVDLQNTSLTDDVLALVSGTISITPEGVTNP